MINLFIIDDHYLINDGFNQLFDKDVDEVQVIGSALNVEEASTKIRKLPVQVIILDLFLKLCDPVLNVNYLHTNFPSIPIIILSQETSRKWQIKMFREGVSGYLSKEENKQNILQTIYMIANGRRVIPFDIASKLTRLAQTSEKISISNDEREIVHKMIKGFSIKEVAQQCSKSISAIEKALKKIRIRFNIKTNIELVHFLVKKKIV